MVDTKRLIELMKADVDPQEVALSGIWYEPRSLWAVENINLFEYGRFGGGDVPPVVTARIDRNFFRNGTRYPITINRIAVAGIGYPLVDPDLAKMQADPAVPGVGWLNGSSVINRIDVSIRVPWRSSWTTTTVNLATMAPQPTAGLSDPRQGATVPIHGNAALRFDKPLILPRLGAIEWDVSSLQGMRWLNPDGGTELPFNIPLSDTDTIQATMAFLEAHGMLSGSARSLCTQIGINRGSYTEFPSFGNTNEGYPYIIPPGFGTIVPPGPTVPFWNNNGHFSADAFRAQNATRAGATSVYGMSLAAFSAISIDTAAGQLGQPEQIYSRIGTRVKCVGGPASGDYWWRPGAPVCLVMDSTTCANVYYLDEPVTLAPGDSVEVIVNVPTENLVLDADGAQVSSGWASNYQIGVSLNGFTAIDG